MFVVLSRTCLDGPAFECGSWLWADGGDGQLGLGNTTSYSSPKQVGALTTWSDLPIGASGITQLVVQTP